MSVVGGNSLADTVSATLGGVGINQAVNVAALNDVTTDQPDRDRLLRQPAADHDGMERAVRHRARRVGVRLVGRQGALPVGSSYTEAKEKLAEQKAERAARKAAEREAEVEADGSGPGLLRRVRRRTDDDEPVP